MTRITGFETEKGSVYTYLNNGSVQRFKAVTGVTHEPMALTLFADLAPSGLTDYSDVMYRNSRFSRLDPQYARLIANRNIHFVQRHQDGSGDVITSRDGITNPDALYLGICDGTVEDGDWQRLDRVSTVPEVGMTVLEFDRRSTDADAGWGGYHIGHKVVRLMTATEQITHY